MKTFNTTGVCIPDKNYMADTNEKIEQIVSGFVEPGKYVTINRARQYGKTTTLYLLKQRLRSRFIVCSLSFEAADDYFISLKNFVKGVMLDIADELKKAGVQENIIEDFLVPVDEDLPLRSMSKRISQLCGELSKGVVLIVDEVDQNSDNQIFLAFLSLLRDKYLAWKQGEDRTFQCVILASVYDIKNMKLKYRPEEEHRYNSPWNIADDFRIDLSFQENEIAGMLSEYEDDHHTGMDIRTMAEEIEAYTSGYPYLVSRICEKLHSIGQWNHTGILQSVRLIVEEKNTLFDDIAKKLKEYPELRNMIYGLLFSGRSVPFHMDEEMTSVGVMFGFLKNEAGQAAVSNRIFEIWFYNLFIAEDARNNQMYDAGLSLKNQFVHDGVLDMDQVLVKFMEYFSELYPAGTEQFVEENGRRLFLLYLKPIINGTGNYYIESRTRSKGRTDVIIDYLGRQYVIEMKIWHGNEYNERGERQLESYLNDYNLKRGYMVSFNFNKNKKVEMKEIHLKDKTLVEIVV